MKREKDRWKEKGEAKLVLKIVRGASIGADVVKEKGIAKVCSSAVEDLRYSALEQFFAVGVTSSLFFLRYFAR